MSKLIEPISPSESNRKDRYVVLRECKN